MGLLDFFKKKPEPTPIANVQAVSQSVQVPTPVYQTIVVATDPQIIHSKINLLKTREEKVKINLEKKSPIPSCNVVFVLDVSGSMNSEFRSYNGQDSLVQDILERIYPIATHMTKGLIHEEVLDCYLFSNSFAEMKPKINMNNFAGYVKDVILKKGDHSNVLWGGTSYAPVMQSISSHYRSSDVPTYVVFITDGDNGDHTLTEQVVIESSKYPIFWQFVGIGHSAFKFLGDLDDMSVVEDQKLISNLDTSKGRVVDNANFFQLNDIKSVSDDELYKRILNEFPDWIRKSKAINVIE